MEREEKEREGEGERETRTFCCKARRFGSEMCSEKASSAGTVGAYRTQYHTLLCSSVPHSVPQIL
eukprot:600255-Rhodomonas_salina.1